MKESNGPFIQAIFAAIFVTISNRPCKLAAISLRFRGDLPPQNRHDFVHARILRRFTGDFFSMRVTSRHEIAASLHGRFVATKIALRSYDGKCNENVT